MLYFIAEDRILENKFFKSQSRLPHIPECVFSPVNSSFHPQKSHF
ncbi:hypothetical protein HMPREF3213_00750 [Heyndrickxia coagulans]|uniref:Uncharacterized protein n=1 Tax=Heyndrickxia coagulans TaxID=1398 RepID=A0A133KZL0_HEYCO|nr:hypothetical protein HMPREF3213_00750 [Heyndrickxia coagulans]